MKLRGDIFKQIRRKRGTITDGISGRNLYAGNDQPDGKTKSNS